jgi:hypothetical protein
MMVSPTLTRRHNLPIPPVEQSEPAANDDAEQKAHLRRQMYERIARGNALAELEDNAHRNWPGRWSGR